MEIRNTEAEASRFRLRLLVVATVVLLAFAALSARLYYLQVTRYEDFAERAESNRTAIVPIVPNRGLIEDRNGVVLATNYSAYTLEFLPARIRNLEETIAQVAEIIPISTRERKRFRRAMAESRSFESIPMRTRLSDEEVALFAAQAFRFPGVEVKARLFRSYPYGETASHAVGYIGRINETEKNRIQDSDEEANYRGTDYIGKLGIEQSYESQLHGVTGVEQMETSAGGRAVRLLESFPATPGNTVQLTLDIKLQRMVEDLFGDRRGALVAIDPRNGEILALVSKPTFDPNLFVEGIDFENWAALNESLDLPLLNRALRGTYPPGSTYKPFMGLAALETGKRTPGFITQDNASWTFGGHTFRSHGDHGLGPVDLYRAIMLSSNVYFYQLANDMGVDLIHDFMAPLGFGQTTGIDLPGEVRGVLPSQAWKRNAYRRAEQKRWYAGETISLGIGQGYNTFTMLQLAHATATVANGGVAHTPHLGRFVTDVMSRERIPPVLDAALDLNYTKANVDVIKRAMVGVTQGGTGTRVFAGARYISGGKTGTAQAVTIGQKDKYNSRKLEEHQRDHALYVAFAPAEEPRIALAVVVENAGWGAGVAAPIARRVFDYWLSGEYPSQADMAAVQKGQATAPIGTPRRVEEVALVASQP